MSAASTERDTEVTAKLGSMRMWLAATDARAVRLCGTDWFAWATAGASNTVLMTTEVGIAELVVTATDAFVLTDDIEASRLQDEELPPQYQLQVRRWAQPHDHDNFVNALVDRGAILSDRPHRAELPLPPEALGHKLILCEAEQQRYRALGCDAAQAMTEVLHAAQPDWTEYQLAGAGAQALWQRGIHPALVLAAGEDRLPRYRHPTPSSSRLGRHAMLVFCARRHGLYASLTRFVAFEAASPRQHILLDIEAAALDACRVNVPLSSIYQVFANGYREAANPAAIEEHHQGGITGYLAREIIAGPTTALTLQHGMALAFNPSCSGFKVEDTFLLQPTGLENLTVDPAWPTCAVGGRQRPLWLERC
jgi:Xaa-Pro aminopeptidase